MKNLITIIAAALAVAFLGGCLGPGYQAPKDVRDYTLLIDQHGNTLNYQTRVLYHVTYHAVQEAFEREFPDTYKHAKEPPNVSTVVYTDASYRVKSVSVEGDWVVPSETSVDGKKQLVVAPTLWWRTQENCPFH